MRRAIEGLEEFKKHLDTVIGFLIKIFSKSLAKLLLLKSHLIYQTMF